MMKSPIVSVVAITLLFTVAFCALMHEGRKAFELRDVAAGVERMFELTSIAFRDEGAIPDAYVFAGQNLSLPLA